MNLRLRTAFAALAAAALLAGCRSPLARTFGTAADAEAGRGDLRVLVLADTHLDPFGDAAFAARLQRAPLRAWPDLLRSRRDVPFAGVGRDANPSLFVATLDAMRRLAPDADAVMVAGDLLAHDYRRRFAATVPATDDAAYHAFVDKTAEVVPLMLREIYPRAQLLPAVGNNDGYCGDYASTPRDAFLAREAAAWRPGVDVAGRAPTFAATYARGGWYEARLANGVRVLGLNSILFSAKYENACGDPATRPAEDELRWLRGRLEARDAPPTLMLTHVPPGVDPFRSFVDLGQPSPFYAEDAQRGLFAALAASRSPVRAMITGHMHNVGYRVVPADGDPARATPVYSAPSVSPIFGNAPAFVELAVARDGTIDDATVYTMRTGVPGLRQARYWRRDYDFDSRYGLRGLDAASLRALHAREGVDAAFRATVTRDRVGGGPAAALGRLPWRTAWCAETALDPAAYLRCEEAK